MSDADVTYGSSYARFQLGSEGFEFADASAFGVMISMIGTLTKQPLVARADIGIGIRLIAEVVAPEQFAITSIINCTHDGNMRSRCAGLASRISWRDPPG